MTRRQVRPTQAQAGPGTPTTRAVGIVVPGRWFRKHEKHPRLQGFVKGATAAAAGAIAGAAIVIGRNTISGPLSALIGLIALALLLLRVRRIPEPALIGLGAAAGLILHS